MDRRRHSSDHRRAAGSLVVAIIGALLLVGCGGGSSSATDTSGRWETASRIANSLREGGAPRPVAECAGERAVAASSPAQLVRLTSEVTYEAERSRAAMLECERSYRPSGAAQPTTPIAIDPEESPARFAAGVDTICAVDFNEALRREGVISRVADARHWTEDHAQAVYHYNWAGSQAETARLVAGLGTPPARPDLVRRWRENVALRGRLFRVQGNSWKRGEERRALVISAKVMPLKAKADRYGRAIGLRVCTSN